MSRFILQNHCTPLSDTPAVCVNVVYVCAATTTVFILCRERARVRSLIQAGRRPPGMGRSCRVDLWWMVAVFFLLFCVFLVVFTPATTSVRPSFGDGAVGRVSVVAFRSN